MTTLPPSPRLLLLRDALLVAAVAVVSFQALRRFVGDYYRVPSGSMEPVLHGDAHSGDLVFVDKLADARACRRHDLVVVAHPQEPGQQMVKRIAARGDDPDACCINLLDGDIWLGPDPQRMRIEQKDPIEARSVRVPWASTPGSDADARLLDLRAAKGEDGAWMLKPAANEATQVRETLTSAGRRARRADPLRAALPVGFVGSARAVDASYPVPGGGRGREGDDVPVVDCGVDMHFDGAVDGLVGCFEGRGETLAVLWRPANGEVALWRNGEVVTTATLPPAPGARRMEFGRLDDRVFLIADGRDDAVFCFARRPEWNSTEPDPLPLGGPRCHVGVAAVGGAPLRITGLTVFRDLYAWRERIAGMPGQPGPWPRMVGAGHWFLLGDNGFDSRDSRYFGDVPASSFLGRPRFVLGPWPRARWLRP